MKKRAVTHDEKLLFRKVVDQAAPLKPPAAKPRKPAAKRGEATPQARLDLHGLSEAAAHRALLLFLGGAQKEEMGLVLVITGKSGVLNRMVPRWLNEKVFAALAAGAAQAPRRHGGEGALYVTLRKRK